MDVVRNFINIISNTVIKPIFISTTFNVTWAGGGGLVGPRPQTF